MKIPASLRYGWTLSRGLALVLSMLIGIQAITASEWGLLILALVIAIQALSGKGCLGGSCQIK